MNEHNGYDETRIKSGPATVPPPHMAKFDPPHILGLGKPAEPSRLPAEPPSDLGEAGAEVWRGFAAAPLKLWPHERAAVLAGCRETDLAERIAAVIDAEGLTLPWGEGGTRAHPLLSHLAEHRNLAARLFRSVEIPKASGAADGQRSRRGVPRVYKSGELI